MKIVSLIVIVTTLAVCGATSSALQPWSSDVEAQPGPAAAAAFVSAFRSVDLPAMQSAWARMSPGEKLAANDTILEWMRDLEDEELERVEPAYRFLRGVDWAGVHAEAEALKATAGLAFGDLQGTVLDADTGEPIAGMTINAVHTEHGIGVEMSRSTTMAVTDDRGRFQLTLIPEGELVLAGLGERHVLEDARAQIRAGSTAEYTYRAKRVR